MRSKVADALRRERTEADLARSADERILRALEIGERELQLFMTANTLTRDEALRSLEKNKHKGRRPSCASENPR